MYILFKGQKKEAVNNGWKNDDLAQDDLLYYTRKKFLAFGNEETENTGSSGFCLLCPNSLTLMLLSLSPLNHSLGLLTHCFHLHVGPGDSKSNWVFCHILGNSSGQVGERLVGGTGVFLVGPALWVALSISESSLGGA